jgi:outer membrane lipoprotein-sorting protein
MKREALFFLGGLLSVTTLNAAKDATLIVQRGEEHVRGKSLQSLMTMKITRPDFTRDLKLRSWAKGSTKSLVEILSPAKETGVASLRVENQMWNYLPKSDQVIRVPTSLMLQSWMGSDFTNDDLMKVSSLVTDYTHKLQGPAKIAGEATVLIECTPKPNAPVVWGKINHWARVSDDLPVKQEYYDEKGKLIRTLTLSDFKRLDDRVIPTVWRMEKTSNPNESTTVTYEKVLYDRGVEEAMFNRDELKKISEAGKHLNTGWSTEALPEKTVN